MLAEVTGLLIARGGSQLVEYFKPNSGIYHVAGKGSASRYEWAKAILAYDPHLEEYRTKHIEPALSTEFPTPATRPTYSAISCKSFEDTFDIHIPNWEESLQLALGE